MKPTPSTRPLWPLVTIALATLGLLGWGCGHTREILYPAHKVAPPHAPREKFFRPSVRPGASIPGASRPVPMPGPARPIDAPTTIDVPIIDRNGV